MVEEERSGRDLVKSSGAVASPPREIGRGGRGGVIAAVLLVLWRRE